MTLYTVSGFTSIILNQGDSFNLHRFCLRVSRLPRPVSAITAFDSVLYLKQIFRFRQESLRLNGTLIMFFYFWNCWSIDFLFVALRGIWKNDERIYQTSWWKLYISRGERNFENGNEPGKRKIVLLSSIYFIQRQRDFCCGSSFSGGFLISLP